MALLLRLLRLFRHSPRLSLRGALVQLRVLPENDLTDADPYALYRRAAAHSGKSSPEILELVAQHLGISSASSVSPLPLGRIKGCGFHDLESLRTSFALPVSSNSASAPYALAIADPDRISVREFRDAGIETFLTLPEVIEQSWQTLVGNATAQHQVEKILVGLADTAAAQGASEIYLGHPAPSGYEFVAGGRRFAGQLREDLLPLVKRSLADSSVAISHAVLGELRLGLTTDGDRPIICLSWPTREAVRPPVAATARRSVLLIEDDDRFAHLLTGVLTDRSWSVTHVDNVDEAIAKLRTGAFTLIVCDIHLSGPDGVHFVRRIRREGFPCPLLVLTADQDESLEVELALLGVDAYVRKSVDPRVFLSWCHNLEAKYFSDSQYGRNAVGSPQETGHIENRCKCFALRREKSGVAVIC